MFLEHKILINHLGIFNLLGNITVVDFNAYLSSIKYYFHQFIIVSRDDNNKKETEIKST